MLFRKLPPGQAAAPMKLAPRKSAPVRQAQALPPTPASANAVDSQPATSIPAPLDDAAPPEAPYPELDDRELQFVIHYALGLGPVDSALAAGYSNGNRKAASSMASRLLRRPHLLRAIKEETGRRLVALGPLGVSTLENLARSARSEQVKLSAGRELVDRGYGPVISKNATVTVGVSVEDLIDRLDQEAAAMDAEARTKSMTIEGAISAPRHRDGD